MQLKKVHFSLGAAVLLIFALSTGLFLISCQSPAGETPAPGVESPAEGEERPAADVDKPAEGDEREATDDDSQSFTLAAELSLWTNEDGNILSSDADLRISKSGADYPASFTVEVSGAYTDVQWTLGGVPVGGGAPSITINAEDYAAKRYILGVIVFKDGIPYSNEIQFTVIN
jgi:hypothetical protein